MVFGNRLGQAQANHVEAPNRFELLAKMKKRIVQPGFDPTDHPNVRATLAPPVVASAIGPMKKRAQLGRW